MATWLLSNTGAQNGLPWYIEPEAKTWGPIPGGLIVTPQTNGQTHITLTRLILPRLSQPWHLSPKQHTLTITPANRSISFWPPSIPETTKRLVRLSEPASRQPSKKRVTAPPTLSPCRPERWTLLDSSEAHPRAWTKGLGDLVPGTSIPSPSFTWVTCSTPGMGVAIKIKRSEGQTAGTLVHVSTYQGKPFLVPVFWATAVSKWSYSQNHVKSYQRGYPLFLAGTAP